MKLRTPESIKSIENLRKPWYNQIEVNFMKESIYTIPISEIFEPKQGCPLCTLYNQLETRWVEYICGAAMMEPDIRVETNKKGFCLKHLEMMTALRNRLSVALILQTRLEYVNDHIGKDHIRQKRGWFGRVHAHLGQEDSCGCFVCSRIDREFSRIGKNIAAFWNREEDFKKLYSEQEHLCLRHYEMLCAAGDSELRAEQAAAFRHECNLLTRKKLLDAKKNIDAFCKLFDHRSAGSGPAPPEVASAIEAAIEYLTGDSFEG
ncbi:MAG: DUF6062 family protein [Oscillospiraceae bacterium]|nr:DUF6062 family protein [Oscillospiraceae bacterium]